MDYQFLMDKAKMAAQNSYSPYSKFAVGACVLGGSGNYYYGCNFENASFGLTICAERNAIGNAIANGEKGIRAITIYSPNREDCMPCGACRQVISEFCSADGIDIITETKDGLKVRNLNELLPGRFQL